MLDEEIKLIFVFFRTFTSEISIYFDPDIINKYDILNEELS